MASTEFKIHLSSQSEAFPHFWEHTVGSGHATLALRADWQRQLSRCHQELGFQHVRFHGLLSDDMGTLMNEKENFIYSFFNADQICDFLLSIGMKPLVELSFMPTAICSGDDTVFHYRGNITPPQDYLAWEILIGKLVQHWVERYGNDEVSKWFFEVWNEPNLKAFWTGSQEDYFKLYQTAARAIKTVSPSLQVGGPATANNEWISDFVNFCRENQVPFDFISTHHYPTDSFGKPGDDTLSQLAQSHRSVLKEEALQSKSQAQGRPLFYTEWCTSSNPFDELHDLPYASAFIIKTVMEARGIVDAYSYWTFSDIFEENYFSSTPFHGGFGLLNIHGIPKPSYRAFELLHHMSEELVSVEGTHPTVDVWTSLKDGKIITLISNSALPRHPIEIESVILKFEGIQRVKSASVKRIDEKHSNATQAWKEMGSPNTLTPVQVEQLERASLLISNSLPFDQWGESIAVSLKIPPQGVVCVTLEIE